MKEFYKLTSNQPVASFAGFALLTPAAFLQVKLLTWLLLAVIAGIILIFILIAFILLPLTRRSRLQTPAAETETAAPETIAPEQVPTVETMPALTAPPQAITLPVSGQRPDGIRWEMVGLTDVGLKRELNEDNLLLLEAESEALGVYGIYVVADGLGGHEAGEVASQITIDTIRQRHAATPPAAAPFDEWFTGAVMAANDAVLAYQEEHKEAEKMGSTLVMALVAGNMAHITNVGDSRAYHITGSQIQQISVDHSLVERLVQIGQITREEARTHKQRNVVYSIIGEKRRLEIGHYDIALSPGDRLLLCSDGLSGMITDEDMLRFCQTEPDLVQAAQAMVKAAKEAGGHDNITAILIQMK